MGSLNAMSEGTAAVRADLVGLHRELVRAGLVAWTSGNVSARVPGEDLFVIKPSGVYYDELTAADMVVCDLHGDRVDGRHAPSSDTLTHAYVYRMMPRVGGIAHTHSTYATAWAARGEPVPCVLTAMADEFGDEIPVGPLALIGGDEIGRAVVAVLAHHRSPVVLMRNHGVYSIGRDARAAVKAAVMCEDAARIVQVARTRATPFAVEQTDVDRLYDRYQHVYGQRTTPARSEDSHD